MIQKSQADNPSPPLSVVAQPVISVCVSSTGSYGMEAACFLAFLELSQCLRFSRFALLRQVLLRVMLSTDLFLVPVAAFNHVFSLSGMDLVANKVISRMFSSFKKTCPPRETKPPEWNLSLVLGALPGQLMNHLSCPCISS